ncbi:MAG: hypothetical protein M1817_005515 [Caeruleum heppii]|nr:MAG: hypothetical protein M1817_005515 [Caeruleum heppii]
MNRSVQQALVDLVPALHGALPQQLLDLAVSLVAQSRSVASNLKADEEIGRCYACAHIACLRLKQTLDLPPIQPRPPLPPRVYSKLYRYLNLALQPRRETRSITKPPTPTTSPLSSKVPDVPFNNDYTSPKKGRPVKHARPGRPPKIRPPRESDRPVAVPPWAMSAIRHLCRVFKAPAAPPHVIAGVTSVLTLPAPFDPDHATERLPTKRDKIPALVVGVFFVFARLVGEPIPPTEYIQWRDTALTELAQWMNQHDAATAEVAESENFSPEDVNVWLSEMSERGWMRLDWYQNVEQGAGLEIGANAQDDVEDSSMQSREDSGTALEDIVFSAMMNPQVRFLSSAYCDEFRKWKQDVLVRLDKGERTVAVAEKAGVGTDVL